MTRFVQLQTTAASRAQAEQISAMLIDRGLAACAQIVGPIESVYRWQGLVEKNSEWLCLAKTSAKAFPEVESAIHELHSYACPEIIATPIVEGSDAYLQWLGEQLDRP